MGMKELQALIEVLQAEVAKGRDNLVTGTWHLHFERRGETPVFSFNKCESEVYCEERPTVFAADGSGTVIDKGGPLFGSD
ncbi:MAG: hypothetical protein C4558_01515 [Dehalococcoidia bacterium]|nr:MAG: hypothetical protein C4558_01515 [Dehalococcoidia bacterium]